MPLLSRRGSLTHSEIILTGSKAGRVATSGDQSLILRLLICRTWLLVTSRSSVRFDAKFTEIKTESLPNRSADRSYG